jgi:putative membrane protein
MWEHTSGYHWGGMGLGMIGMSLFWILLIVAIVVLVKSTMGPDASSGQRREKTALDILKERYARGEIEREEFEQKKLDLEE